MVSAMGRLEKSVDAHKSDILVSKISKDGSSIMTGIYALEFFQI